MKRKRCILLWCLVLFTFVLSMTGCKKENNAGQTKNTRETTNKSEGAEKSDEIKKISVLNSTSWPIPGDVDVNDNKWANIYKEALPDIEIEWIIVPASALREKKNILMATGDMPDMLPCDDTDLVKWVEQGLIHELDDLIKDYFPNQDKYLTENELKYAFYKGKQYRLLTPKFALENPTALQVRKDWLDKMGLSVPQTLDDAFDIMKKFTFEDPDGNGKDDTFGYTSTKNLGLMGWVFSAYDVNENFWSEADGEILPDIIRPEMKDALAFIKKLYDSGVYDKDSLAQAATQVEEKVTSGNIGFTEFYSWGVAVRMNPALKENDMELVPVEPLKGPAGKRMYPSGPNIWGRYAVTITCKHPEAPLRIINWLLDTDSSLEYKNINGDKINCGEIGVDCRLDEDGNYLVEDAQGTEGKYNRYRLSYRLLGGYSHIIQRSPTAKNFEAIKAVLPYVHYTDKTNTGSIEGETWGELKTYYDEIKMRIVTGDVPIDEFDKWIDYFYKNGGQEIIDEANELNK